MKHFNLPAAVSAAAFVTNAAAYIGPTRRDPEDLASQIMLGLLAGWFVFCFLNAFKWLRAGTKADN